MKKTKTKGVEIDALPIEIRVPSGIGDGLWVAMKLDPTKRYHVKICGGIPYRAHQFWELLPFVEKAEYDDAQRYPKDCTHEFNQHLEAGGRIDAEGFTNWALPLHNPAIAPPFKVEAGVAYVGVYESSVGHGWRKEEPTWSAKRWLEYLNIIAHNLHRAGHDKVRFVVFGAEYDNFADTFIRQIPYGAIDCRRKSLPETISGIMQCTGFIGFPSGIPILANYLGIPTVMPCHSKKHRLLANTFCRSEHIGTNFWKAGDWGDELRGHQNWLRFFKESKWPVV